MADAANRLIASMTDEQKAGAVFDWDSEQRKAWYYVPRQRAGLTLKQMTGDQRLLTHALLQTALSHSGYRQAMHVMVLDRVLRELENSPRRDPEVYYVSFFGKPSHEGTWAWRFEGHHLSINFTLVDGKLFAVTPSFFGANPAEVKSGPFKGLRTLAEEEDMARELVKSLSDEQKKAAIFSADAPREIITGQDREVKKEDFTPPRGIAFDHLHEEQQKLLIKLVEVYARKYRPDIIEQIDQRTSLLDGKSMHFAWAGGIEPGQGHYYRIQHSRFLFEYDNTQNNANHVHAVWRNFDGDFGEDLLRKHYETAEHHKDKGSEQEEKAGQDK